MSKSIARIGRFTADNVAAILGAIPESNGTYADITTRAIDAGANLSPHTVARWVIRGRHELAGKKTTALARFAQIFDDRIKKHCGPDVERHRELDKALSMLDRICDCGNEKMLLSNGQVGDQCRQCEEMDTAPRKRGTKDNTSTQPAASNGFHPASALPS